MATDVRYCTASDGVRLAYSVEGQGPALLWSPLIFESLTRESMTPVIARFLGRLRERFRVVRFDQRGTGLSQRDASDFSPAVTTLDIEAVLKAAGIARVFLLANPGWTVHFLTYAAIHPESVVGVVTWNGQASMEEAMPPGVYDSIVQMIRANWPLASRTLADFGGRIFGDEPLKLGEACRESATAETVAAILDANRSADAGPLLPRVSCPTLILVNQDMLPQSMDAAQRLAAAISHSHLVVLSAHEYVLDESALGRPLDVIVNFFAECDPSVMPMTAIAERRPDAVRTVLFTDLVAHTEMMSRLGDDRGRDVLREHERITREVLKANGGTEVKTMGDGFMASFGSVTKAVECAIALQRAFSERNVVPPLDVGARRPFSQGDTASETAASSPERNFANRNASPQTPRTASNASTSDESIEPLHIRVGLNAGEPIEEDGDLFGATVILAARIAAKAGAGEILVADTVRGLCSGKGFLFSDRGEFVAKGFEDPVRVSVVRWRE